jgi:hypothetical protein
MTGQEERVSLFGTDQRIGIVAMKGDDQGFVIQGVHVLVEGAHQRLWKRNEKRSESEATNFIADGPECLRMGWAGGAPPLTVFDGGIEAGGAHRHVKADQRDIRQDYWYRYGKNTLHVIGLNQQIYVGLKERSHP